MLQVAKSAPVVPSQPSRTKTPPPEWEHTRETPSQPSLDPIERYGIETPEETSAMEDEGDFLLLCCHDISFFCTLKTLCCIWMEGFGDESFEIHPNDSKSN